MIQGTLLSKVESRSHSRIRVLCEMDIRNLFFASPTKVLIGVLIVLVAFFRVAPGITRQKQATSML